MQQYTKEILDKIHENGWNPYKSTDSRQVGKDSVLRRGPAQELETMERYVLMPLIEDDRNPKAVFAALEKVAVEKLNRESPSIEIKGRRFVWTGFIPKDTTVKVNTPVGHHMPYDEFLRALDTMTAI